MSEGPLKVSEQADLNASLSWSRQKDFLRSTEGFESKISTLSDFECWTHTNQIYPYLIFESDIPVQEKEKFALDFLVCLNLKQENPDLACEWLMKVLSQFKLSFSRFHHAYLTEIIEESDPHAEVFFLDRCVEVFDSPSDTEACLERLSMLLEKKLHKNHLLEGVYQRILQVNPNNLRALKFFKLALLQAGEWEEGSRFLRRILENARNQEELNRSAQELASILLYQLDKPEEAIEVLKSQNEESQLDNSSILFESYRRLGWNNEALILLDKMIGLKERTKIEQSTLLYKKGEIFADSGKIAEAARSFNLAIELNSTFFEAYEQIIAINLSQENWEAVLGWINELKVITKEPDLLSELDFLADRVQSIIG